MEACISALCYRSADGNSRVAVLLPWREPDSSEKASGAPLVRVDCVSGDVAAAQVLPGAARFCSTVLP
ncbi:hypothetical protein M513_13970 [Trichuris suis]|uniref:Uncharacterized protein n=1 Tax=Trichuris suis TaxID=68888 RepID=A0A085LJK5_9BILA|nr:hypothetical protein M513_13970 [Trichuris suis]